MPSANLANIKQWHDQSDVDYFTYFVKAWIPFNAWYRHSYDTLKTEREILDQVKSDGNSIRSRFIAKIEGGDPESQEIRNHIAALHRRLSADPLTGRAGKPVNFEKVLIGPNPQHFAEHKHGHWFYRVERITGSRTVVSTIKSNRGNVVCTISQTNGWKIEEFELDPAFVALNPDDKPRLRQCYEAADPFCFASLLAVGQQPADSIPMDGYFFVKDKAAIFAGLIEILYAMRNLLFHGELVPDPQTNRTYEPAYHLLRCLTKTII